MENEEEFDQKRFLVAMILSGLIIVLWQAFFAPPPPPVDQIAGQTNSAQQTAGQGDTADGAPVVIPADAQPQAVAAPVDLPVKTVEMRTDELHATFSTRGARLVAAKVLHPEQYNVQGDLLRNVPDDSVHFPFGIEFTKRSIALQRDLVWQLAEDKSVQGANGYEKLVFRHTDPAGRFAIEKSFAMAKDAPYQIDLEISVTNNGPAVLADNLALDITGWKDPDLETSFLDPRPNEVEAVCSTTEDTEREMFSAVENALVFDEGTTKWGGIDSRYFLFAAIPRTEGKKCMMDVVDDTVLRMRIVQPEFSVAAGDTHATKYRVFVGPKDYDVLEAMGSGIEQAVDYGIFTFLARPFRWLLVQFHGFVGNWGLAIILLTFLIRLILWPINQKVYVNSEKMKELQPKLTEIREKYADDQQRLGEETMKVWKDHGVNPLGCLPMVLQFPILLALYFMILNSVELYQADFILWYTDLSASDPYFVLPILMGIVMFAQQSMMTVETPNPQMATMMKVMPIMFTAFMLFLPSGVVLYYFVSLIIGLLQQFWIRRSYAAKKAQAA